MEMCAQLHLYEPTTYRVVAYFSFGSGLEMTVVRSVCLPGGTNSRVSDKTEPGRGLFGQGFGAPGYRGVCLPDADD